MPTSLFDDCKEIDKEHGVVTLVCNENNVAAIIVEVLQKTENGKTQKKIEKKESDTQYDISVIPKSSGDKVEPPVGEIEIFIYCLEVGIKQKNAEVWPTISSKCIKNSELSNSNTTTSARDQLLESVNMQNSTTVSKRVEKGSVQKLQADITQDISWLEKLKKDSKSVKWQYEKVKEYPSKEQPTLFPLGYDGLTWVEEKLSFLDIKAPEDIEFNNTFNYNNMMKRSSQLELDKQLTIACADRDYAGIRRLCLCGARVNQKVKCVASLFAAIADTDLWNKNRKVLQEYHKPPLSPSPDVVYLLLYFGADPSQLLAQDSGSLVGNWQGSEKKYFMESYLKSYEKDGKYVEECKEIRKIINEYPKMRKHPCLLEEKPKIEKMEVKEEDKGSQDVDGDNSDEREFCVIC